ncbi:MAG: aspartate/glutamate racemase family protein [Clostridia bacterium]|nr:aspartate/glutamate racemase family protein [Clostridia bacterium]
MVNQPRLGILGGMGPQATLAFYQRILDMTDAGSDQEHLPTLIWSDTVVPDRTACILSGDTERVYAALLSGAKLLEREGCTALAVPCNTSHFFADRLQNELNIPLLNMVRLTARTMKDKGCRRVGVLATDGTIQTKLYQTELERLGIEAVIPGEKAQRAVMTVIYDQVKSGKPADPGTFAAADLDLRAQGCDGAILACTELSVYRLDHGLPDFYTDAMDVLAAECVKTCGYPLRQG